ncbi:MAG TPA: type IV pilus assembly protein PilM [bacterium]|nr:type IV pilus assembly protein PilM [bacterium]
MFNFKNSKNIIGLDISDLNFKAAQLTQSGKKIKIQALSRIDLPKGAIERGSIKDEGVAATALRDLLSKPYFGSFSSNQVVACLPETRTFIKLIDVAKGPNTLENIIESEIEKYIPMSVNEIYYDWQTIKETDDNYSVLIGAAPKHIVNQYIELIRSAKMEVSALEIEAIPICRSLLVEESSKNGGPSEIAFSVIDIGAKRTSLIVYANGSVVFTLSLPISGEEITERIAGTLEITRDQAEKAKIICGLDKTNARGIIGDILSDIIQELIAKINDAFEYYSKNYSELPPIKKIVICGGGSNIKNLNEILAKDLNVEVIKGDPFANIDETENEFGKILLETHSLKNKKMTEITTKYSVKQSSSINYATSIGLALRNIFLAK